MLKRVAVLLSILLLTQGVLLPVSAACPETEEPTYDGYLVQLVENAPVPYSREDRKCFVSLPAFSFLSVDSI